MAHRSTITSRQRRLGAELRRMRERVGVGIQQAADMLGTNRTHITNMELARFGVSEERLRTLAAMYKCQDSAYVDGLISMTGERKGGWWEDYRGRIADGGLDLAELEHHAVGMEAIQSMHMPGILQTEDYARALFALAVPAPTSAQLNRRVSFRMRRRDLLDRDDPPDCTFFIHEAALRMRYGGPRVLTGQLERTVEASRRPNITVRAIPFEAGGFASAGVSSLYVRGPVPQLDTLQMDNALASVFMDAEAQLKAHLVTLERIAEIALPPDASRDFILDIVDQLRKQADV